MLVGRLLGVLLLALGAIVLVRDLFIFGNTGRFGLSTTGEVIGGAQPAIQAHVPAWLWEPIIVAILRVPALLLVVVPGVPLVWLCQERDRRPGRH